jgi:glutamate racemase
MPLLETVYVADQAHIPYGPLPPATILGYSEHIVQFLEEQGCDIIVIACNTASAAALQALRTRKPHLHFVGMEPAIKPAAERSRSGVVVVLATANTLEGELFQNTSRKYATAVRVLAQPCPGLVEQIERGETDTPATRELLRVFLEQPLLAGADTCVLGCTHYAFVRPLLEELMPPPAQIIDPADAVARRVQGLLEEHPTSAPGTPATSQHQVYTTGRVQGFASVTAKLLDEDIPARALRWTDDGLQP